ncbi:Sulfotransferase [Gracilaria domingensis]|nr:Sulfotransferase [Gracilaria domingensis]
MLERSGASTLRVAVQRNPFDRLISAFNDKFSCAPPVANPQPNYSYIVPYLRRRAGLPDSLAMCMNISEFADAVDVVRQKDHETPLQTIDLHIRPQRFYFEYVPYDIVLDVKQLSNVSLLKPVLDRLPFANLVEDGVGHYHAVTRKELMIPETAAKKLFRYAAVSEMGELRHVTSATASPELKVLG